MNISKKRIFAMTILPIAVLLLSGCGFGSKAPGSASAPAASQESAPATGATVPQPTQAPAPLPPLPDDNKQAIDSEIQGIDQELQAVDNSIATDAPDGELGL